jgi:tetratricopeptide (TPR) repeat protein
MVLAAPGLTWLDGGELALAAGSMGVAHPPGEPAYLVLGRLAALLPVGDLPFRLTLLSATTVALAGGVLSRLAVGLLGGGRCSVAASLAGAVAGLAFLLAPGVQLQAVRPELYGLVILLLLLCVAALELGGRRGLALAVLPLCVAGAVHHAMLVAAIPGLLLLAMGRGKGSLKAGAAATIILLIPGLLQFAWLPLRSLADPALDFGTPRDLERVLWSVSAAGYARSFHPDMALILENLRAHGEIFVRDLGWPLLGLACIGLASAVSRSRRVAFGCLLLIGVGILPTVLQGMFRQDNPDARGYLLAVYATICMGAGIGASLLAERLRRAAPRLRHAIVPVFAAILLLPAARGALASADLSQRFLPARLGDALLDSAEPGALLLLAGDSWSFPALYARYWEGRRADIELRPLYFLDRDVLGGLALRGAVRPVEELLASDERIPAASRPEHLLRRLVDSQLSQHPVQVNEAFLPSALSRSRREAGLLYSFGGEAVDSDEVEDLLWKRDIGALREDARYASDPIGPGVLARRYASRASYYLETGRRDLALISYRRASSLASDPWDMVHLLRSELEQGASPLPADAGHLLLSAERAFLEGDVDRAARELGELTRRFPTHPRGLLFAERLYSLGRRIEREGGE